MSGFSSKEKQWDKDNREHNQQNEQWLNDEAEQNNLHLVYVVVKLKEAHKCHILQSINLEHVATKAHAHIWEEEKSARSLEDDGTGLVLSTCQGSWT